MKKRICAIDFDSTLADTILPFSEIINKKYGTKFTKKDVSHWGFFEKQLGLNKEQMYEVFEAVWSDYRNLPPTEKGIGKTVDEIKNRGYEIMILTKRDENHIEDTLNWLDHNGVNYDDFVYIPTDRDTPKHAYKWSILIDDAEHYISGIPENRLGILHTQPWNLSFNYQFRINNMSDIIRFNIL